MLMHFRSGKRSSHDISFSEPIDTDRDGNPLTLMDVIAEEDNLIDNLELKLNAEKLHRYMRDVLDEREQEIIARRYGLTGDGLTQREVSKQLDISRSYVSRIEKKALEKLKKRFIQGDFIK
jgi:RNA polymerase sporulation-specific sigma factor